MFRRLLDAGKAVVNIRLDGAGVAARAGDTVAAVLLAHGRGYNRTTPVSGAPRAPYCMMGVCFECLVKIDGRPNRQACLITVVEGMRVETQDGAAMPGQE